MILPHQQHQNLSLIYLLYYLFIDLINDLAYRQLYSAHVAIYLVKQGNLQLIANSIFFYESFVVFFSAEVGNQNVTFATFDQFDFFGFIVILQRSQQNNLVHYKHVYPTAPIFTKNLQNERQWHICDLYFFLEYMATDQIVGLFLKAALLYQCYPHQ